MPDKTAAMYYKYPRNVEDYAHTNNWEISAAVKILNSKGYSVDIIDRSNTNWQPNKKYDLFLGLGVGNRGAWFPEYAKRSGADKRVLLAMGPQPDVSQERTLERYDRFKNRTGQYAPPMRTVEMVTGDVWKKIVEQATHIFNIGEKGSPSYNSYVGYGRPVLNFYPGISPHATYNKDWLKTRDRNSFLCFAGNGFIIKGVDVVLEAFLKDPSKTLHICGPNSEKAFFDYYGSKIKESKNINYHGFIKVGGDKFNQLASKCSYVIFNSASEACCTSVCTAMKAGLVPIVNSWTGISIEKAGFKLQDDGDLISNISEVVNRAAAVREDEYNKMVELTNEKAKMFSQESFIESYTKAIESVI